MTQNNPEKKIVENVHYLKDELGSIRHLKELIEMIRDGKISKFIIMSQSDHVVEPGDDVTDVFNNQVDEGEVYVKNHYYFFGDCPTSNLLGLNTRMGYILNLYMDGVDVFGEGAR